MSAARVSAPQWVAHDGGAGGVLALAIAASVMAFAILALSVFSVLPAKARVHAAADSAAIAAAEASCELAEDAAVLNEANLVDCMVGGGEATVIVERQILGMTFSVTSHAGLPVERGRGANGAMPIDGLTLVAYPGVRESPPVYLRDDAAAALLSMLDDYHLETGDYLPVDEGYRDLGEQQRVFDLYGWPRAAIPGTSNHGEGIAVDFVNPPVLRGAASHSWLTTHASQFGFAPLTDPDEPWHWEFKGTP